MSRLSLPSRRASRRAILVALALVLATAPLVANAALQVADPDQAYESLADGLSESLEQLATNAETQNLRVAGVQVTPAPAPAPETHNPDLPATPVFADADGVELALPSTSVRLVGFHEATKPRVALAPHGTPTANHNPGKVDLPGPSTGPNYLVLPSRGRPQAGTTSVDVAVEPDTPILSPVTGTVISVDRYALYGETSDWIIHLQATGRPDLGIMVMHIVDPQVWGGEHVHAGETVIAGRVRRLPFVSQIEEFAGVGVPHVHMQVQWT